MYSAVFINLPRQSDYNSFNPIIASGSLLVTVHSIPVWYHYLALLLFTFSFPFVSGIGLVLSVTLLSFQTLPFFSFPLR